MAETKKNTSYQVRPDKHTSEAINNLNPEKGVIVYDKDDNFNKYYNGTDWIAIGKGNDPRVLTPSQGFIDYNDTTGSINLISDTWTNIPNNGLGSFTNKNFKPLNVSEFINTSTGDIDCSEVDLGDSILVRNDFQVNPNTNNSLLEFRYQLGNGGGLYTLETNLGRLDNGSGKNYRFSLKSDLIYMGDTNTRDNPISLQVKLSTNGTLLNAGTVVQLIKRNI